MLIEHSLRIAGRSARITEAAGIPLVAFVPATVSILSVEQSIEVVVEADVLLDRRPLRLHSLDQRREGAIIKEDAVLRVIDDILELVVEQPWIERVENAAHADDPEPSDEMAVMVHRHGRHAVAWFHAKPFERLRQTPGSCATRFQFVRWVDPSARAQTISLDPCSRSAWSISRMIRSGKSCIAPSKPTSASPLRQPTTVWPRQVAHASRSDFGRDDS